VKKRWDEALRSLARRCHGPFRLLAYGVTGASEDESVLRSDLDSLLRGEASDAPSEAVGEVADPFTGAMQRPIFKTRVLPWMTTTPPPPAGDRRRLEEVASELAGFLDSMGDGVTVRPAFRLLPEAASEPVRSPLVLVRQFEDLGGDSEGIASAMEAIVVRGGHLRIVSEGIDTRTREGRAMARVALRLGAIKADRARERSLRDLRRRREGLQVYGPVPFGFNRRGRELVPVADQMDSVARVRELSRRSLSLLEITLTLNREGRAWKDGTPWTWKRVRQVLHNPIYEGPLGGGSE
jgi:DNA invertase Pin-like site-specific DNA recombinase